MSSISIDDVKKLAVLSALSITDDEADALREQLEEILGYVEQLDEIDTSGVAPTYQVSQRENVMRDDEIIDYGLDREQLLACSPEQYKGQIKVNKVL